MVSFQQFFYALNILFPLYQNDYFVSLFILRFEIFKNSVLIKYVFHQKLVIFIIWYFFHPVNLVHNKWF